MKKFLAVAISLLVFTVYVSIDQDSEARTRRSRSTRSSKRTEKPITLPFRVIGTSPDSKEVQSITAVVTDLVKASNSHNLEGVLRHYSPDFISGDNLSLEQVRKLIEETWQVYPDIQYETKTLEIRVNGDWATVESLDHAVSPVLNKEGIITEPGTLKSDSRGMIYLRRIGNSWEITSDYTLYEQAVILYGDAQTLKVSLSVPDQVFAGEAFTAKVNVALPPGMVAIASISKDPLVYPQLKPKDKFRSMSPQSHLLERVFEANGTNNNEIVTATIGLTRIENQGERPTVQFKGVATVIKRVNVVPRTDDTAIYNPEQLIQTSASGLIDLRRTEP